MNASKQNTNSYQKNKQFISCLYKSKEDFSSKYKKNYSDKTKPKELYLQILNELKKTIQLGNVDSFKNLSVLICYISNLENKNKLKTYYDNTNNPLQNSNLVILACKHNQVEILKNLFDSNEILNNLSVNIGKDDIAPDNKDETCHNAFYYAIRSGNVALLDILINKWPRNYFAVHLEELEEIVSRAYEELKIKNVLLSDEMEIFVENKLINLRFFADGSGQKKNVTAALSNIKQRIDLVLENISSLNSCVEVDEEFLFIAKFIAQNIHILKRQLKVTYDRLPWEEIEFCVISFVSSHMKQQGINLFYHTTLNKSKILNHLKNFAIKLKEEKDNIDSMNNSKLSTLSNSKREIVVAKIIDDNPQFKELYDDYQQIRDVHSLEKISTCIKVALTADPKDKEGQLIIIRTLQVIGEYLKNTLESPKLSNFTSELLLLSLPKNTREVIKDLRNSLSHANSLSRRTEIEENVDANFFSGIQNDTKKIESVITDIFHNNKMKTIRILLNKIITSENVGDIEQVAKALKNVGFVGLPNTTDQPLDGLDTNLRNFTMTEHEKLEKLLKDLSNNITEKTSFEEELFNKINKIISSEKSKSENCKTDYFIGLGTLQSLNLLLRYKNFDNNIITGIKFFANKVLENITPKINPHSFKHIADLSRKIFSSVSLRIQDDRRDEIDRLIYEIFVIIEFGLGNIKWIEELREELNEKGSLISERKQKKISNEAEEKYNNQLALKLSELKSILNNNALNNKLTENFSSYKSDPKLQAVVEMLVLDIMSILGSPKDYLTNNLLFLDDNTPLLTGKSLRNHLAHDNVLIDVLLLNPSIAVILNAKKLTSVDLITSKKKIGKLVKDDPSKLNHKYNQNLLTITNQKKMFVALEEGNLEDLKSCLKNGADVSARSLNLWTTLHFAAKGPSVEVVKFLLEQNLSATVKDISGQSPLHIAAANGRKNIVEFFIEKVGLGVDIKNNNGETPLHIAADNGHKDTVMVLLKNKANTLTKSMAGNSPLHDALKNNHVDVVKVLLEKDANVDINETMGGFTPLHMAAERGYLELVNFLLQNKADVNAKTDRDYTPLHAAAFNGFLEIVNVLISKGARVNARVIDGCSPLHYAVENGHESIVDVLLKQDVHVNVVDKTYNNTPLHYAAKDGHEGIVKSLLKNNANANAATVEGITPLHFAAQSGHLGIVIALLKHGVDVNAKNIVNATPLHYAALSGHREIADLLIKNKAKINATDLNCFTPLYAAAMENHEDVIDLLIQNKAEINIRANNGDTPLHEAAANGSKDVIDLLIKNKSDVNARNYNGFTPLHSAVVKGCKEAIVILIENKADVNTKAISDFTPLHAAILAGHKDVVSLLIKNGANVNAEGKAAITPLHVAVEAGSKEIVEILIANKANINVKNKNDQTPLTSAVKQNNKNIVEFLIVNGANINVEGDDPLFLAVFAGYRDIVEILLKCETHINKKYIENATLLHLAATRGHKSIVNALIRKGADVNAKNINNTTPLHLAAHENYDKIVEVLLLNGANIDTINNDGSTSLHLAAAFGHNNVVEVLLKNGADVNIKDNKNRTSVELAIVRNHLQVVRTLLEHQTVDVNARANNNWTMLHISAQAGNVETTKCLLDNGADMNARNSSGSKPAHIAAREGHKNIVEFFLKMGLNVNDRGAANQTLLHYSALESQLEVAEYLIKQGIDVNTKDANGSTPLHIAARYASKDFIEVLLKNGAFYNTVDNLDKKPSERATDKNKNLLTSTEKLFEAVKHNSSSDVKKYIRAGAFVNANNSSGTALHYAVWKGYDEVVDILLQNNADSNASGKKGFTPLHYAAKFSHLKVAKTLLTYGAIYNVLSDTGKTPLDIATDKDLVYLFQRVNYSFQNIRDGHSKVVNDLKKIKAIDTVKAIMNARNRENKTLVVTAMLNNFPKIEQLKQILQDDVSPYIDMAEILLANEKYQEAAILYKKVLEKRKEILGPDNPGTLDIQEKIAIILYKQHNYQEALNMFEEISQKQTEILGINNEDTLKTRSTIALVLHRQGKNKEALKIYKEVYEKQKEILGIDHPNILDTQAHMALVLDKLCKYEEALSINYEVFEKRKKMYGINGALTLVIKNNIAMVLNNQGKHDEAVKIYREVYEARKIVLGPVHSDTLRALHNMISVFSRQQNYDEAVKAYKEVFETQKTNLGSRHLDTLNTQFNIANLLLTQGKFIGALKNYKECSEQRKAILGSNHPDVLHTLKAIELINFRFKLEGSGITEMLQHLQNDINVAASNGDVQTIQCLLRDGADANDKDVDGITPIHYAVSNGQIGVVNILLKNGADVTQITNKGNTPLHTATCKGNKEIIEILLKHVSRSKFSDFINAQTSVGRVTALHVASQNGFMEIVKFLLKNGAIYNIKNKEDKTPLDISKDQNIRNLFKLIETVFDDVKKGNDDAIDKLKSVKSDELTIVTNTRNDQGKTLLQVAITSEYKSIANELSKMLKTTKSFI